MVSRIWRATFFFLI
ncbi:neurotransmitter gated ion channel, partial [Danaus plexippus plexippus]